MLLIDSIKFLVLLTENKTHVKITATEMTAPKAVAVTITITSTLADSSFFFRFDVVLFVVGLVLVAKSVITIKYWAKNTNCKKYQFFNLLTFMRHASNSSATMIGQRQPLKQTRESGVDSFAKWNVEKCRGIEESTFTFHFTGYIATTVYCVTFVRVAVYFEHVAFEQMGFKIRPIRVLQNCF